MCTDVMVQGIITLVCTDVMVQGHYLLIFNSGMDCRIPSHRCGRLYFPMFLFNVGLFTLMYMYKIIGREDHNMVRAVKEAIYIIYIILYI